MEDDSDSESSHPSTHSDQPPPQSQEQTKTKNTKASKLDSICESISKSGYTPKTFTKAFLKSTDKKYKNHRRYWGSERGWKSTKEVLEAIKKVICKKKKNRKLWEEFILSEATTIIVSQKPPIGAYPSGSYHSTRTITEELFTQECKEERDMNLAKTHMPFLFRLICNKRNARPVKKVPSTDSSEEHVLPADDDPISDNEEVPEDLFDEADPRIHAECQSTCDHHRVNQFLNYIGLSSSRKTAHQALKRLGWKSESKVSTKISQSLSKNLAPFLCIDNLDFEQKVHNKSLGKENRIFHGTWGYVHHPNPKILASIPAADLTLESYRNAMALVPSFEVLPKMFLPSSDEEESWELVIKAQIAEVLFEHVASSTDSIVPIPTSPPAVDQLSSDLPDITMLKLMVASDKSAQGVGEVFESILEQTNMNMTNFASRLQIIDGDLGTCTNLHSLRSQRIPSQHIEEDLNHVCTLLGGSHTLWNIAQAIYSKHYGDDSDARDSGAWRFLEGMSIPANKMLDKKDYTLMIQNIVKIHKAALVHCIKTVMGTTKDPVPKELPQLSSQVIHNTIEKTYEQFFTATAQETASNRTSPKLSNLMLRLSNFATIVEGNTAMKCGDIGRLMNVWKRWSVMAQAPSGRHKHFVAKDQHLEDQNYWLKYFFNRSGRGTNIDRLKDVYSLNVPLLQSLIHGLTSDAGKNHIYQSHRCSINLKSINNCLRMCNQNDICHRAPSLKEYEPIKIDDFYLAGISKLKEKYRQKGKPINKLRPTGIVTWTDTWEANHDLGDTFNNSDVSSGGDEEPNESETLIPEESTHSSSGSQ
ncbi:hypothetical protein MJO28_012037 [Puccinia striiformis f. sp. tritici]|uniref:Uncharacterized protein n=1 Tax=Puccinia striiformis f. sp. tritici TaxID=168172 RepID=A0ACC0DYT9_9BASI|nr:hypothetical protein MJO28_012037 [Puccinia striiformis f. sp. tritici]